MAIRVVCPCKRQIRAPDELAGRTVKCPDCGRNVPIPAAVPRATASQRIESPAVGNIDEPGSTSLGRRVLGAVPFYWSQRGALRSILGELIQALQSSGDRSREIRLNPDQLERRGKRNNRGWSLELPECCVVCGELTDSPRVTEPRDAWDLTWPIIVPAATVSLATLGSLLLCSPWLLFLALPLAPLAGALSRRKATIELSLSRCAKHRDRLELPRLWSFGNTLVIRTGDAEVVEAFHSPDRLILRRQEQIRLASQQKSAARGTSVVPATRPTAAGEQSVGTASAVARETEPSHNRMLPADQQGEGWELAPRDIASEATERRCRSCGVKLLPQESACPRCHLRQSQAVRPTTVAAAAVASAAFDQEEQQAESMSMWAAVGKLILSLTEMVLAVMLFCIFGAGAVFFAERWELTTRAGIDLDRILLVDLGVHPLTAATMYASALGLMLYYGATGLAIRNGVLLAFVAVGLTWYFQWPFELWMVGVAAGLAGMALGILQAMFESRFAQPLGVLLAPGQGMLPGRPTTAGLVALAKGVLAGGFCGFLLGAVVSFPVYLYGTASGWEVGQQGATRFTVGCAVLTGVALAYLAGQFAMTKAEQIGGWRGMFLGAELWGFCSFVAAATIVGFALANGSSDRPWWQLVVIALLVVTGATISGGLVGLISGAIGGRRGRAVIPRLR